MTSRERILAAIEHREPDRVPVDLGSTPSSGISAIAYNRLKARLNIAGGHTRVYDVVQQLAQPEDEILDRFRVDVVDLGRAFDRSDADWRGVVLPDGSKAEVPVSFKPRTEPDGSRVAVAPDGTVVARMPAGAHFFDQACFPYVDGYPDDFRGLPEAMSKVVWAALPHSPWNHAGDRGFWRALREKALGMKAVGRDRAIMVVCGCNLFEWGTFLRRLDNFLMDLALDPTSVERLLDALMERHLSTLEAVCRAVGDVADILRFGDDLGTDRGTFMRPETYRRLFKPRQAALCAYVKTHSRMKTFLHSCGSIAAIIPDLIEAGYDVLNPVQTNARDMEPERLKREFGADVTFWGAGVDTRAVLNRGTPAEVKDQVKRRMEILAPGGGFVFNTVHNILPDVPPENVLAMFEAVAEFNGSR